MSISQPDLHREMLARVKEFNGDDDKWPGWWFKLQSFLKANHIGYEALIERIVHESDATRLTNTTLNNADKKHSSSLYYVLGLTMTDDSAQCGSWGRCNFLAQVVGGVSARHRQSSLWSFDDDHELDDSCDRSDHCNQRAGFEDHCLLIAEHREIGRHSETWSVAQRIDTPC